MAQDDVDKSGGRSRRGRATREKILSAAEDLVARHGPDGFQLQQVTDALGITPPALYNHFKDREDLVAQIAENGGRMLAEIMRRGPDEDVLTSLRRNARRYVAFLIEHPAHARIILSDLARRGTTGWRGLAASNIAIRERMSAAFEAAQERGEIRPVPLEAYLQALYIGSAAAAVWTDYEDLEDHREGRDSPPLTSISAADLERLQDQAEDLVVRLLSPELGEISE